MVIAGRCHRCREEAEHAQLARGKGLRQSDHWVPNVDLSTTTNETDNDSGRDELDQLLTQRRVGVYCGVDPTAPSLHVGHMVPFMVLAWMYIHGYHSTFLVLLSLPVITTIADTAPAWRRHSTRRRSHRSIKVQTASVFCHTKSKHGSDAYSTEGAGC